MDVDAFAQRQDRAAVRANRATCARFACLDVLLE